MSVLDILRLKKILVTWGITKFQGSAKEQKKETIEVRRTFSKKNLQ